MIKQKTRSVEQMQKDNKLQNKLQQDLDKVLQPPYKSVLVSVDSSRKPKYIARDLEGNFIASSTTHVDLFSQLNKYIFAL
jgi:hypothetical protein